HEHHHDHAHVHQHSHDHSYIQANVEHFDKMVDEYENIPGARELMTHIGATFRKTGVFSKEKTNVLDFACGIGMLSREIFPISKSIVGIDISPNSVKAYNHRAAELGAQPGEMGAVTLDILHDDLAVLGGAKFDVAVCSMAYHHFEHPDEITRALVALLNPDGHLFVVDFLHGHPLHKAKSPLSGEIEGYVPHVNGFSAEQMRATFEGAGLQDFKFDEV
ncbi:S-adenosyl-L-methionine-dependent methyltransferase, partial [Vararia minispora EC-137]